MGRDVYVLGIIIWTMKEFREGLNCTDNALFLFQLRVKYTQIIMFCYGLFFAYLKKNEARENQFNIDSFQK